MPSIEAEMIDGSVRVAVAVIVNDQNQVLISKRAEHVHQGGLWEFPGGKIEENETLEQALAREIKEELNIDVIDSKKIIKINHCYNDKAVQLNVQLVNKYSGTAIGAEGQPIKWKNIAALDTSDFPAANKVIIHALQLPNLYTITGAFNSLNHFKELLTKAVSSGRRIIQLRCKACQNTVDYLELVKLAKVICEKYETKLLLNSSLDSYNKCQVDGLHLTSSDLFKYHKRPIDEGQLLSVSCHNESEILQAKKIKADIILLSPVNKTSSHPGVDGIGWDKFNTYLELSHCPVYALGGMQLSDLANSKKHGAQGIAAISSLWQDQ